MILMNPKMEERWTSLDIVESNRKETRTSPQQSQKTLLWQENLKKWKETLHYMAL